MAETSIPLEFPDYRRFTRTGDSGRIFETRSKDAPKIFCPVILRCGVTVGKERNGVEISQFDLQDIAEGFMKITSDLIIDVIMESPASCDIVLREPLQNSVVKPGDEFNAPKHHVTIKITAVLDTSQDDDESRRSSIHSILAEDVNADSVYITVPQTWVIPDPEFRPRTSILPLYPGSFWLQFFKSNWGLVAGANIVFNNTNDGPGNVGLLVKFKEVKAMRQCLLSLFERYLIHPKEGYGMKSTRVRVMRHSAVIAKKTSIHQPGVPATNITSSFIPPHQKAVQAATAYANSKELPMSVSEAFLTLLDRLEKLEREHTRVMSIMTDNVDEEPTERERSPRARDIPKSGLPPWRQ